MNFFEEVMLKIAAIEEALEQLENGDHLPRFWVLEEVLKIVSISSFDFI